MANLFRKKSSGNTPSIDLNRVRKAASSPPVNVPKVPKAKIGRRYKRKDAWAVCRVHLGEDAFREGIILDLSDGGARVRFRSRGSLPAYVRLSCSRLGVNREAYVVWQDVFDAGLQFVDAD